MKLSTLLAVAAMLAVSAISGAQGTKTPPVKHTPKKAAPLRDAKTGKFVKKSLPARDPKTGRFVKKHDKGTATKKMPARDPKTGRFIKKTH